MFQHAWKSSATISYCEPTGSVVPVYRNFGIGTALVVVIVTLVFIECDLAGRSPVDTKLDRVRLCES